MSSEEMTFNTLVETVYALPLEDRLELKALLEHSIINSRRTEIAAHFANAKKEEHIGTLSFNSDIDKLKSML